MAMRTLSVGSVNFRSCSNLEVAERNVSHKGYPGVDHERELSAIRIPGVSASSGLNR
jgi:hypothetical protein